MKYYTAFGKNGVGLTTNYYKALSYNKYIRGMNVRSFPDRQSAEAYALDHLSEVMPYYIQIPEHLGINDLKTLSILKRDMGIYD